MARYETTPNVVSTDRARSHARDELVTYLARRLTDAGMSGAAVTDRAADLAEKALDLLDVATAPTATRRA
jgi:hypothetical protein